MGRADLPYDAPSNHRSHVAAGIVYSNPVLSGMREPQNPDDW